MSIKIEWNFFATSHGKGACDGIGGSVKRSAYRASLQRHEDNQIISPSKFFTWAKGFFKNISFEFCTHAEYEKEEKSVKSRYAKALTIKNTRQYHSFQPSENGKYFLCKKISSLPTFDTCSIVK